VWLGEKLKAAVFRGGKVRADCGGGERGNGEGRERWVMGEGKGGMVVVMMSGHEGWRGRGLVKR